MQIQRYEGASTIFGPHTHAAYVQNYVDMVKVMVAGNSSSYPAGPSPPDLSSVQWSLLPGVVFDSPPLFKNFGDVLIDANASYTAGDTVKVTFVSANPRNNQMRGSTFLTVELYNAAAGTWDVKFTDAHYEVCLVCVCVYGRVCGRRRVLLVVDGRLDGSCSVSGCVVVCPLAPSLGLTLPPRRVVARPGTTGPDRPSSRPSPTR